MALLGQSLGCPERADHCTLTRTGAPAARGDGGLPVATRFGPDLHGCARRAGRRRTAHRRSFRGLGRLERVRLVCSLFEQLATRSCR